MSKHKIIVIGTLISLLVLAIAGCGQLPAAPAATGTQPVLAQSDPSPARTITVVGSGSAFVEPDVAQANVGVNVTAPTIQEASDEVNQRMSAVLATLKEEGIAEKDIQTSNYSIYFEERPQFESMPSTQEGPGGQYRVSNQVQITIRDLDKVGPILDAVIQAGANNVYGVSFTREDAEGARSQARSEAVKNALAKAQEYAELNGLTLGDVVSVSEVIGGATPFGVMRESAAVGLGGGGPDISPGQLEVQVQVQVTYEAAK